LDSNVAHHQHFSEFFSGLLEAGDTDSARQPTIDGSFDS
jgi:hypothetical protein